MIPFAGQSSHAGYSPPLKVISVLWIVKGTYTHCEKNQDIEVYNIENGSVLPSLHLFAFFMWHIRPLLFLLAAYEVKCEWALIYLISLYWEMSKPFPIVCQYTQFSEYPSIAILLLFSIILIDKILEVQSLGQTICTFMYILNIDTLLTSTTIWQELNSKYLKIRSLLYT